MKIYGLKNFMSRQVVIGEKVFAGALYILLSGQGKYSSLIKQLT